MAAPATAHRVWQRIYTTPPPVYTTRLPAPQPGAAPKVAAAEREAAAAELAAAGRTKRA